MGAQLPQETLLHVAARDAYVVTVDGVRIPRSAKHVAGSSWWPAPNTAHFRRRLELAWLTPAEDSYYRAMPMRRLLAPTAKSVPCSATPCREWKACLQGLTWARALLTSVGRATKRLVGVLVGSYDPQGIWKAAPEHTTLLVRRAKRIMTRVSGSGMRWSRGGLSMCLPHVAPI